MQTALMDRAKAGDDDAFRQLVDLHRRELHVHCYRILGSAQDAEDALQETLLTAWRSLGTFEGRCSLRTWLYRIATSRCLNSLRSSNRRKRVRWPAPELDAPRPTRMGDVVWLEPYPDALLEEVADRTPGPEARFEAREAISLAFITALQHLPARQRAVVVLRDVLGFHAREVADVLEVTEGAVTSALKRARATLRKRLPAADGAASSPAPGSSLESDVVARFTSAYEASDLDGVIAVLTEDVWLTMPPIPLEYQGKDLTAQFFATVAFRPGRVFRLVPTRANGQPAFGIYMRGPNSDVFHANGLLVISLAGSHVNAMARFDNSVLPMFGLPRSL